MCSSLSPADACPYSPGLKAGNNGCPKGNCTAKICCERKEITHASRTFSWSLPDYCAFPYNSSISPLSYFFFLRVWSFLCALRKPYPDWAQENLSHGIPCHAVLSMAHPWIDLTPTHLMQIWSRRVRTRRNRDEHDAVTIQSNAGVTRERNKMGENLRE